MNNHSGRMPAIFVGHGNPMFAIESNRYTDAWRSLGTLLPKPAAILAVSPHWYIPATAVTAMARPRTIHDFGGFPQALFDVEYPATGSPGLARRVQALLDPLPESPNPPGPVLLNEDWGLDHGTWSVLLHLFPGADVPVVQLSLDSRQTAQWHYDVARRLGPLRDEGILILGSGNIVHNLRRARWEREAPPHDWAQRFSDAVRERVRSGEHDSLIDYAALGDDARLSVPTPEHYLPLLYVIAQQQAGEPVSFPVEGIDMGAVDMLSIAVGWSGSSDPV